MQIPAKLALRAVADSVPTPAGENDLTSIQNRFRAGAVALVGAVVLGACGGGGSGDTDPAPPRMVTTISVSPSDVTLEALGATAQLVASARDQNGSTLSAPLSWSSSDTTVVTVDADGLVTALNNGMATVTVRSGNVSAFVTVTVEQTPASITLSSEEVVLKALGEVWQLEASVFDANDNAMSTEVIWASSDPTVAAVDGDGRVSAHANGTATVTANAGSVLDSVAVKVQQAVSTIDLVPGNVTLTAINQRAQFAATALDANGHAVNVDISFTSSEPMVAEIDEAGAVIARRNGMSTVTASVGSVSDTAAVTVTQVLARITLVPDDITLTAIGDNAQLHSMALDANGNPMNVEVNLSSSDPTIATVNATGLVTARGQGITKVSASSGGFSDAVTLNVNLREAALIVVTPTSSMLEAFDATAQLHVKVLDVDGQEVSASVDWASSDPAVAEINTSGLITARGNGTATIAARSGEVSGTATVRVLQRVRDIRAAPRGQFLYPVLFISLGETVQFTVDALDPNGHVVTGALVSAKLRESGVVRIDDQLLATAIGNGDTVIDFWVNWAGITTGWSSAVRVRQVAASLEIEPTARTFRTVDETFQFTAAAKDANDNALPADFLLWQTADRRIADVDTTGLVSITGVGDTTIEVFTAEGRSASATVTGDLQATCESDDRTPSIASVGPAPLVEGASFMIQGSGFCGSAAGNLVTVDRMVAEVTAASDSELTVTVPQFHCLPARQVMVSAAVGQNMASRSIELRPDEPVVSLAVGSQQVFAEGEDKCLQFAATSGSEAYLIGVQSTLLTETNKLTPVRLIVTSNDSSEGSNGALGGQKQFWSSGYEFALAVGVGSYESEQALFQESPYGTLDAVSAAQSMTTDRISFPDRGDIETLPEVGDIVILPHDDREWMNYKVGKRAIWLVDSELLDMIEARNSGVIEHLSDSFDTEIYPVIADLFGAPDLGRTGRVVVRISEGWVANPVGKSSRDWHMIAIGSGWLSLRPRDTLAHEFVHVVQQAAAWDDTNANEFAPGWLLEGQAQLGAEAFALAMSNLSPAQNYGYGVVHDTMNQLSDTWADNFYLISLYLDGRHPARPQECSWLTNDPTPCLGRDLFYGVGWSLLRYLTDQYGRLYPGGDGQLHRELIHSSGDRSETIERLMGETMETLLARWAAALYVDDRIASADPNLQFTSWNFWDIFQSPFYTHPDFPQGLIPLELSFSNLDRRARVRDGSMWYVRIADLQRPSTAIRVRDTVDRDLTDDIQIWIVRL